LGAIIWSAATWATEMQRKADDLDHKLAATAQYCSKVLGICQTACRALHASQETNDTADAIDGELKSGRSQTLAARQGPERAGKEGLKERILAVRSVVESAGIVARVRTVPVA